MKFLILAVLLFFGYRLFIAGPLLKSGANQDKINADTPTDASVEEFSDYEELD